MPIPTGYKIFLYICFKVIIIVGIYMFYYFIKQYKQRGLPHPFFEGIFF